MSASNEVRIHRHPSAVCAHGVAESPRLHRQTEHDPDQLESVRTACNDDVASLARRYLAECLAVARADGAQLGDEVIEEIINMLASAPPAHHDVDV